MDSYNLADAFAERVREAPGRECLPLAILYTSGTMGKPRGVVSTHKNLVFTALKTAEVLEQSEADRVLVSVPLFTIFGIHIAATTLATGVRWYCDSSMKWDV